MNKLKKIIMVFSPFFWRQVYLLFSSFITGNVLARYELGKFDSSIDVDIIFLNSNFDKQLDKGVLDFWFEFLEEAGIDYNSIDFDNETSYSPGS